MAVSVVSGAVQPAGALVHPAHTDHEHGGGGWTSRETTAGAMRPMVLTGQCFGIFSFAGSNKPRFSWGSWRSCYFYLSVLSVLGAAVLLVRDAQTTDAPTSSAKFISKYSGNAIYAAVTLTYLLLFSRLSRRWHRVVAAFRRVEDHMGRQGQPGRGTCSSIRRVTVAVVVVTFAVEMVVDAVPCVVEVLTETSFSGAGDFVRQFYYASFRHMAQLPAYNVALVAWSFWMKAQSKLLIAFNDLILWVVGVAVASKFQALAVRLGQSDLKSMTERHWESERETYNGVVALTAELDVILGPHVLLSFGAGLWFICGGILLALDSELPAYSKAYIVLSTGFWSARLVLATLSMATVYDQHRAIRNLLNLVPTRAYGDEVSRFLMQASHDDLGFTGMKFFKVTRSVLLTLAGTIASYEIVLMEFN